MVPFPTPIPIQILLGDWLVGRWVGTKADAKAVSWAEPTGGVMVGRWERELVKELVAQLELLA